MNPSLGRLRFGEWLASSGAIVMAASLFALHWYGGARPRTGWDALTTLRWPMLVTVVVVLAAVAAQLRPGPALAAALDVVALLLSSVTAILLAIRLATTGASLSTGAFVGVAASVATALGVFVALRTEEGWTPGSDHPIEVVSLPANVASSSETH